jgi:hypothetical protein
MADTDAPPAPASGARRRWAPWVSAAALAVLCALIAAVLPHVHGVSARARSAAAASAGQLALPDKDQAAVIAAGTEAVNLLTYSRKTFSADWTRALNGSTGALRSDHTKQRSQILGNMTTNKVDWRATLEQKALESVDEKGTVLVLVTVNGYLVNDNGQRTTPTPQRLELSMVFSNGKWLASDLSSVGIQ